MTQLADRVAIVTGASRGIGRSIALRLAQSGARVVAAARGDHADAICAEIAAAGGHAKPASVDVTDTESISAMVSGAMTAFGRIDILVNNAGITRDQLLLRMKREDWDAVIATNLTAAFACAQAVLRPMIKQRSGRIISIGSVVGQLGNAGQVNYAASKAGLIGFSKALAREVASRGVTVNVVAPGLIATDMTRALAPETQQDWSAQIPLGRLGTPEDVAAAVCFLASDEAAYITGHVLAVNGGMFM
jgi:3-oxoacyl-[acyl-carrier protein] reductase